jgi:hypothetical protein
MGRASLDIIGRWSFTEDVAACAPRSPPPAPPGGRHEGHLGLLRHHAYIQAVNILTGLLAARLLLPEGRGELAALMLWPGWSASSAGSRCRTRCSIGWRRRGDAAPAVRGDGLARHGADDRAGAGRRRAAAHVMATQDADIRMVAPWVMAAYIPSYLRGAVPRQLFQGCMEIVTWNLVRAVVPTAYLLGIAVLGVTIAPEAPEFAAAFVGAQLLSAALALALVARRGWLAIVAEATTCVRWSSTAPRRTPARCCTACAQARPGGGRAAPRARRSRALRGRADRRQRSADLVQTAYNVAFPKISGQATREGKVVVFGRYLRLTIATVLAIDVILIATNHWLVPLLFGRPFAPSAMVADLLLIASCPTRQS